MTIIDTNPQTLGYQYVVNPKAVEASAEPWLPLTLAFKQCLVGISDLAAKEGRTLDYETVQVSVRPERELLFSDDIHLMMRTTVMTK